MSLDARQLGLEGTMDAVRRVLADRFLKAIDPAQIPADEPLFAVGVGLSSLEGMEFLLELERQFGVRIKNVDWWVYDSPTLRNVAQHVLDLSHEQAAKR